MSIKEKEHNEPEGPGKNAYLPLRFLWAGVIIVFVGFLISFFGIVFGALFNGEFSGGVVIFVGPFPIIFGVGPQSSTLILLGLIITLIMIVIAFFIILTRKKVRQ